MKENVLDVLMYLFQNYMDDEIEAEPDRESLQVELLEAGFPRAEIHKAFDWLDDLAERSDDEAQGDPARKSIRVYSAEECSRMDVECRGFLMFLEQSGVVTPAARELIIDRVMALETEEIDIDRLKWVVMMVLFNQPGQESTAYDWIEDVVFDGLSSNPH